MAIRKIQAARVITLSENQFIGEKGTLFYSELSGFLRVSDGHTPGGIPVYAGSELSLLRDVAIVDPVSGQTLVYDGSKWVNTTATNSLLNGLSDVEINNLQSGEVLQWNGNRWVNVAINISAINPATTTTAGIVIVGDGLSVDNTGRISVSQLAGYILQAATKNTLGGVIVGDNINVDSSGTISVPVATNNTLGVVQAGYNVNIDEFGVISVNTGAGINKVIDISDVYSRQLQDGSLLVYNQALTRWDTTTNLPNINTDGGEY